MRVLWVTPYLPDAGGGGGAAHEFALLRSAVRRHDVELIVADLPPCEVAFDIDGVEVPARGVRWRARKGPQNRLGTAVRVAFTGPSLALWAVRDRIRALRRAVAARQMTAPADLVHVTMGEIAPVVAVAGGPTALLLFDVYSRQMQLEADNAALPRRRALWASERRKMARWERTWYQRSTALAAVSAVDADAVATLTGRRVDVLPNPVADEYYETPAVARSSNTVAFVANLGYRPNVDAVEWLCDEIWPTVIARCPDARLEIVGRHPVPAVVSAAERSGATLMPNVPDVRPAYWRAAVTVAPIRLGSGLRNKVIHAMACGSPLVATPTALEGIDAVDGQHLLLGQDAEGMAAAIVDVLRHPQEAADRAARAREVAESFRANRMGELLEEWWARAVGAPPAVERPRSRAEGQRKVPSATVVICTRDRPRLLETALRSVKDALADAEAKVIVVEQGTPTATAICERVGLVATVVTDDGLGVSRARNRALAAADTDVVLFTDDDCQVPPSWIGAHVATLADPDLAASFGPVAGLTRVHATDATTMGAVHRWGSFPWLIGHSSNMAVRVELLRAVGGFDERLGPGGSSRVAVGGEDADVIVRLLRSGGVIRAGVGVPVSHAEWRSEEEHHRAQLSYERGAGAWIGKMLRDQGRAAMPYLRERLAMLSEQARIQPGLRHEPSVVLATAAALGGGLLQGFRLSAWPEPGARPSGGGTGPKVPVTNGHEQASHQAAEASGHPDR